MIDARLRELRRAHDLEPTPESACALSEETLRIGAWPPADLCCLGVWLARASHRGHDVALRGWMETVSRALIGDGMPGCRLVMLERAGEIHPLFQEATIVGPHARRVVAYIARDRYLERGIVVLPDEGRAGFYRGAGHIFDAWGGCARLTSTGFVPMRAFDSERARALVPGLVSPVGAAHDTRAARVAVLAGASPAGNVGRSARARRRSRRARA